MALSILKYEGTDGTRSTFRIDLGRNRFYAYAVGSEAFTNANGLKLLSSPRFISPLLGPLDESARGRARLEVPNHLFDRDHRAIQLMSFRTENRVGPAISDIVTVPILTGRTISDNLPELGFARNMTMEIYRTETVPFKYRERQPLSQGMFWNILTSIIPKVLPIAGKLLGGVLPSQRNGGSPAGTSPAQPAGSPAGTSAARRAGGSDAINTLITLLQNLIPASSTAPTAQSLAIYSEAKFAPALLAALPSLMPLLQQVLTPETIQSILSTMDPSKMIGAVTNSVKEIGNLGIASHEQDLKHLRELNPGVNDPALDRLLEGMSLNLSELRPALDYRRVESVRLQFDDVHSVMLYGRTKIVYKIDRDAQFPLSLQSPRPIANAVLQLIVKNPATLEILFEKKYRVEQADAGRLSVVPAIPSARLSTLAPNEDYLVCAALIWKNKSGRKIGTSMTQLITTVGEYSFDRVEESGDLIPLNDVGKHREVWHKIWQGSFSRERRRVGFDCKYYYALEPGAPANAKMETLTQIEETGLHKEEGKMKAGMIMSLRTLNKMISYISPHPVLNEAEITALRSPDFVNRFNQAARTKVRFSGRPGDSAALWVYPEVKMQQVILQRAEEVNSAGHVLKFSEHAVHFPMPALAHFIGTGMS